MQRIDISTIREKTGDLITLNDGYLLYQSHEYDNVLLHHDSTLNYDFVISANFKDVGEVTLYVANESKGNCSCVKKTLCKHEVCLYFLLRDKVNEIMQDTNEMSKYETSLKVDRMLNSVYNASISVNSMIEVKPTLVLESEKKLFLDVYYEGNKYKVKDIKGFFNAYNNESVYTFNYKNINLLNKSFSYRSKKLLNMLEKYESNANYILFDSNVFDDIYELYSDEIYVYNGYYSKPYVFTTDDFALKINITKSEMNISDTDYIAFSSIKNDYIIYKEKIYVINNHNLYIVLDYLKQNNGAISFNKESYRSFLVNVYSYIKDYVSGVDYCYNLDIDTYLDYKDGVLRLTYKTDIEDNLMFIKRTNYLNYLEKLGFNNNILSNFDNICHFVEYEMNNLKEYGALYLTDNVLDIKISKQKRPDFNFKIVGGVVEFIYNADEYSKDDFNKILLSYKNGLKYVTINSNIIEINDEYMKDISNILDEMDIDRITDNKIKLYQAFYLANKYEKYFTINAEFNDFCQDMVSYNDIQIKLDDNISNIIRDYQISGVKWLYTLSKYGFGGILADDMGLGKTLQIISLINLYKPKKPVLIVSPTSLIFNWAQEIDKFAPGIKYNVVYDVSRRKDDTSYLEGSEVIITSYETLRINIEQFNKLSYDICVVDEAQFIKNPDALKAIAVKSIDSRIKIALTGTPIENSLLDLWSIFDFVLPGYLGTKNKFIKRYEGYMTSSDLLKDLNKRLQPFMLRRLKTDVLDLEPKIESISYSHMSPSELDLYNSYLVDAKKELLDSNYKMSHILSIITRLRQIACEPRIFLDNLGDLKNSKMDLLLEIIEEKITDNHKILVFSQFVSIFKYIKERLEKKGIKYLELTGQTKTVDRAILADKFNNDDEVMVFLISLKAGGTGLNLTSADTVIHYDPWWNNAVMNQATDRAYRIGQERIVHEIKLVAANTIEEKIIELQEKKKFLFDSVISEDDIVKKLTIDDIKELFR